MLHPGLLAGLARAGHGALVLIADANYPSSTARGPRSRLVHLNLRPGVVDAVTVLEAVAGQIPVEEATVMAPARSGAYALDEDPPIWARFTRVLARTARRCRCSSSNAQPSTPRRARPTMC